MKNKTDYTDSYTNGKLLWDFYRYTKLDIEKTCKVLSVDKDNIKEAINSFDLSTLQERKIIELQGLIFNKLHIETFNYDVPDDENEYCKHIGYVLLNRLEEELSKRSLDKEKDFARTKTQN